MDPYAGIIFLCSAVTPLEDEYGPQAPEEKHFLDESFIEQLLDFAWEKSNAPTARSALHQWPGQKLGLMHDLEAPNAGHPPNLDGILRTNTYSVHDALSELSRPRAREKVPREA